MLVCSTLILVDRNRNLMRSVGLMSIAIGCQRVPTSIVALVPHDIASLVPLAHIILGIPPVYLLPQLIIQALVIPHLYLSV